MKTGHWFRDNDKDNILVNEEKGMRIVRKAYKKRGMILCCSLNKLGMWRGRG